MRRFLAVIFLFALVMSLAGCFYMPEPNNSPAAAPKPASGASQSATPENTPSGSAPPAVPMPTASPQAAAWGQVCKPDFSFAHADEIFADPDAYKGKVFAGPFTVMTDLLQLDGASVYYANGFIRDSKTPAYTVLEFKGANVPDLLAGSAVYVYGVVEGTGTLYSEAGDTVDMLWLTVTGLEADASEPPIAASGAEFRFGDGEYKAVQGPLSIEVIGLNFTKDGLMLFTKTVDTSAKGFTTYYFDIVIHQDGRFALYPNCNYWINGSETGYDNVPFTMLSSEKDITIEFVPFGEDGKLLYEPLSISIPLSKIKP